MLLEAIIRTVACTSALILAITLARANRARLASRIFGAALCLGAATYLACSGSQTACTSAWMQPALVLASEVPFFFWGWTTSIVDDDFTLSPAAIAGAAVLLAVAVFSTVANGSRFDAIIVTLHSLVGIGFVIVALMNVLQGWRQDLVEARRRLRALILLISGGYSIGIMSVELVLAGRPPSSELLLLNAVLLSTLLVCLACGVLDVSTSVQAAFGWTLPAADSAVEPAAVQTRDREQELIDRLRKLMTQDAAYRDANLAVALLASRLNVTEKKLREVINQRLGFKNFSSFVNAFRLEEVRRRLLDTRHDETPILTMALEAGFGSIVAFNRAFKEKYGVTPTVFRSNRNDASGCAPSADPPANH